MHGIQTKTPLIDHFGVKQHLKSFIMLSASNYALKYLGFSKHNVVSSQRLVNCYCILLSAGVWRQNTSLIGRFMSV